MHMDDKALQTSSSRQAQNVFIIQRLRPPASTDICPFRKFLLVRSDISTDGVCLFSEVVGYTQVTSFLTQLLQLGRCRSHLTLLVRHTPQLCDGLVRLMPDDMMLRFEVGETQSSWWWSCNCYTKTSLSINKRVSILIGFSDSIGAEASKSHWQS